MALPAARRAGLEVRRETPPNERLQHQYLRQGFIYVRTVVLPHNPSGALFQRPAERVPTPCLQEVESLTG